MICHQLCGSKNFYISKWCKRICICRVCVVRSHHFERVLSFSLQKLSSHEDYPSRTLKWYDLPVQAICMCVSLTSNRVLHKPNFQDCRILVLPLFAVKYLLIHYFGSITHTQKTNKYEPSSRLINTRKSCHVLCFSIYQPFILKCSIHIILRFSRPGSMLYRSGSVQKSVRIGGLFLLDLLLSVPISGTIQQIYAEVVPRTVYKTGSIQHRSGLVEPQYQIHDSNVQFNHWTLKIV